MDKYDVFTRLGEIVKAPADASGELERLREAVYEYVSKDIHVRYIVKEGKILAAGIFFVAPYNIGIGRIPAEKKIFNADLIFMAFEDAKNACSAYEAARDAAKKEKSVAKYREAKRAAFDLQALSAFAEKYLGLQIKYKFADSDKEHFEPGMIEYIMFVF